MADTTDGAACGKMRQVVYKKFYIHVQFISKLFICGASHREAASTIFKVFGIYI